MVTKLTDSKEDAKPENADSMSDEQKEYDISRSLKLTGHVTTRYANGLTLGVRMEAIPGTRGVHVDIVFVLDLREAAFGKGGLRLDESGATQQHRHLTVGVRCARPEQSYRCRLPRYQADGHGCA